MDTLINPDQPCLSQPKFNLGNQQNFILEWIVGPRKRGAPHELLSALWDPVQRGVHHLVESGVQPKGGSPISAIEGPNGWAHISRQMVAD
jgi:hypothetical protein